ncbi:MAG: ATP-binding protein [Marinifilaceae bacterium]
MSDLYRDKREILNNDILPDIISSEAISFFAENSNLGFFKHDVLNGVFYFSKKSLEGMSLPADTPSLKEEEVEILWGSDLYNKYIMDSKAYFSLGKNKYTYVYDYIKDGKLFSTKIFTVLSSNEDGDLAFVEVITLDSSPMEDSYSQKSSYRETDFRKTLNNISSVIFLVDKNYDIVEYNFEGEDVFSISINDSLDKIPLATFFDFDKARLDKVFAEKTPLYACHSKCVDIKSKLRNYLFNIVRVENVDNNSYLLFSGLDISDSLRLEEHLKINALKYRSIFEQSPVGINIYDRNACLIDSNPVALEILALSDKKDMLGFNLYDCLELTDEEKAVIDRGEVLNIYKIFDFHSIGKKYVEINISKVDFKNVNNEFGYIEILIDKSKEYTDVEKFAAEEVALRTGKKKEFALEYRVQTLDNRWKWVKSNTSVTNYNLSESLIKFVGTTVDIDRIKKAEQMALDRENLLHMTLNVGKIGLWKYDVLKDEISLENYLVDILNIRHASFGDSSFGIKHFLDIVHDYDKESVFKMYETLLYGGVDSATVEFRLAPIYESKWVSMTVTVNKRDKNGKSLYMNGFIMNVHYKTIALEDSRRVQYLLENSLKIAKVGYFYQYYNEKKIDISDTCCKIYALESDEIRDLETFITKRIHYEDVPKYRTFIDSFIDEKTNVLKKVNYRIVIDGEIHRITEYARLYFDDKGKRKGTLYAAQDVTDVYESEVALRELLDNQRLISEISILMMKNLPSDELIDSIIDNIRIRLKAKCVSFYLKEDNLYQLKNCSSGFSCFFSQGGKCVDVSEIEYIEKQLVRSNPIMLTSPEPLNIRSKEKEAILFIENCNSLFLPIFVEGNYHGFLLVQIDDDNAKITGDDIILMHSFIQMINLAFEKIHTQTELIKAKDLAEESDRLKTSFLKNMSHEIRTPLNSIVGFSNIIADAIENPDDEISEYSKILSRNTDQLLNIVNNVIDFSEIESSVLIVNPQPTKLLDVCNDIYQRVKPSVIGDVNLKLCDCDSELIANVDPIRLKQVLLNLVCNAVKYTKEGEVSFGFEKKDEGVQFFVFDSGIGISEEIKEVIFKRFYQEDRMSVGIGLGLSIVKAILNKIKSKLWFESEEGIGSKFYFFIPNCIE